MLLIYIISSLLVRRFHCNLVNNPGFENDSLTSVWTGNGAQLALEDQSVHTGHFSLRCYNRTSTSQGPTQDVHLKPATRYTFYAYVKQLSQTVPQQKYHADIRYLIDLGGASRITYTSVAKQTVYSTCTEWIQLQGCFMTPAENFSTATLSLAGGDTDVDILVDDFYLQEIPEDVNWRAEAKARTDINRKKKVHLVLSLTNNSVNADYTIKVDLKRHQFGFGAILSLVSLDSPDHQQLVYDNFNWATVNLHASKNHDTFAFKPVLQEVLGKLHKHNINIRGKSVLSTAKDLTIYSLNETSLNETLLKVVSLLTPNTHLFSQLEVLTNEHFIKRSNLHNTETAYQRLKDALPNVELFLTDSLALHEGYYTHEFTDVASRLKNSGLDCIGVALQLSQEPDPTLLQNRLDELSKASLPIWITEIQTFHTDDVARADWMETALRVLFSHPAVKGVTFDIFTDRPNRHNADLFGGEKLQLTRSGERVLDLMNKEWSTHVKFDLIKGTSFTFDGYHGDYDITVYRNFTPIMQTSFHLERSDLVHLLHIDNDRAEILLPTTKAPLILQNPSHVTTTSTPVIGRQMFIGSVKSTSDHVELNCVTRWSNISGTNHGDRSDVGCKDGEVLTGCSSVKKDPSTGDWDHKGEIIARSGRSIVCRSINGLNPKSGVFAVARCCTSKDLSCNYRSSGPSPPIRGALQETVCPANLWAVGCLGSNYHSDLLGVYPSHTGRECLSENGASNIGSMSAAACCATRNMLCTHVTSLPGNVTKGTQVSVTCDAQKGYVMTSCSARSNIGMVAGTYVIGSKKGDLCVAFSGADRKEGVRAVATCCWVGPDTGPLIG